MNRYLTRSAIQDLHGRHVRRKLLGLFACLCTFQSVDGQTVQLRDRTDWWSINNENFRPEDVKARNENIALETFEIAGVYLGQDQFKDIAMKMGKAPIAERGDASTGREQVCYVASEAPSNVYLIFEFGADESIFYLFTDGKVWNGERLCVKTKQISMSSGTKSGLRLGITRAEAERILGKPDAVFDNKIVYSREVRQKHTPAQFETLRKDYGDHLTDKLAHEKFDFYTEAIYIEARFSKSGLNYLAVSKSP